MSLHAPLERYRFFRTDVGFGRLDIPEPHLLVILGSQRHLYKRHITPLFCHIDNLPAYDKVVSVLISLHPVKLQPLPGNNGTPAQKRINSLSRRP